MGEKTRLQFAQQINEPDLFDFRKRKSLVHSIVRKENIYCGFDNALLAMITSFQQDKPCCLFCSNVDKLNELVDEKYFSPTSSEEQEDVITFLTYTSDNGIILCKYYSSAIFLSNYVVKHDDSNLYVTNTFNFQPLSFNSKVVDLLGWNRENSIRWYIVNNPGDIVSTCNSPVEKLNGFSLSFYEAMDSIRYRLTCDNTTTFKDYILVPNKISFDDNTSPDEQLMISCAFPFVNSYIDFTNGGTGRIHWLRYKSNPLNRLPKPLVFNIFLSNVYFDVYNKHEVKRYCDSVGIYMDDDES